jgi:anion-transporting  ArsA/GET3 family ATPase
VTRPAIDEIVSEGRLVVCVGPGGVGKTTLAAALGVRAAMLGRHAFVLTIDPARRLADALGLSGLIGDDAHRVSLDAIDAPGSLTAAMLEASASYDALIGRITASTAERDAILDNRVYRAFSRTLARSHAYVAMERLYHALEGPDAPDLVILDTPPTRSALDILDAPGALSRFADDRVVDALAGTGAALSVGAVAAGKLFGLLAGQALGSELSSFLRAFVSLRQGFSERARHTQRVLREQARFVLVVAPEPSHVDDASHLALGLRERGIRLHTTLANRAFTEDPLAPLAPLRPTSTGDLGPLVEALAQGDAREVLERARAHRAGIAIGDAARAEVLRAFVRESGAARTLSLPRAGDEPTDVRRLHALACAAR